MADFSSLLGAAGIGGAIGKAIVQLELDTAKYQAELKTAQASTVTGTNSMGNVLAGLGGVAKAAFAGAGVAAVAFGAVAVKAAIEANEAHLKLQNTFENNPRLADSSVEAFERQADALRDLTGVDDEAIISGQALLGSFKLTGSQVEELTPLVVDLASKYDIDLQAAFKAVGKATQGSAGVLSRYGVTLDENKLKADAFGTTLKGLGVAEGFAADRAEIEPWRRLGASFEEIAEQVGQQLLPVLQEFAVWLTDNGLPIIEKTIDLLGQLGTILSDIAGVAFPTTDTFGDVFDELGTQIEDLLPKFPELETHVEALEQKAGLAAEGVTNLGDSVVETGGEFKGVGKEIAEFAGRTGKELKEWRQDTRESFKSVVLSFDDLTVAGENTTQDLIDGFQQMRENAGDFRRAMRELGQRSNEWIPEDFRDYLSTLGPADIITFADANERQQRRMVEDWEVSGRRFKESLGSSFLDLRGYLDDLDRKTTNHTVKFKYEYVGFDPSKPGMIDQQKSGV